MPSPPGEYLLGGGGLAMDREIVALLLIMGMGIAGRNQLVTWAAVILIAVRVFGLHQVFAVIEEWGINAGLTVLTVTVLLPFATGESGAADVVESLRGLKGLTAVAAGLLAAWLGARGLDALAVSPEVITGVLVGTILGTVFLRGIPVGPLVAVGMAAVLFDFVR